MPSPNPTTRREYRGAAAATTLQTGIGAGDSSFTLVASNNWPTGSVGNFIVTIDRGQSNEERILCSAQSARVVTVAGSGRGFDGTSAASHSAGASVECTLSAFDADEWNAHSAAATAVHGVATVAGLTEVQTFTNKTLNGAVLDAASTIGGVTGTAIAADHAAWTAYTPNFSAGSTPTFSTNTGRYLQIGKLVVAQARIVMSSTAVAGNWTSNVPVSAQAAAGSTIVGHGRINHSGTYYTVEVYFAGSLTQINFMRSGDTGALGSAGGGGFAVAVGDEVAFNVCYEAA